MEAKQEDREASGVVFLRLRALCIVITGGCYCTRCIVYFYVLDLITLATISFPHGGTTEYRVS